MMIHVITIKPQYLVINKQMLLEVSCIIKNIKIVRMYYALIIDIEYL